jgi:FMN phosphatase YigB (HAD superfamily)
VPSRHFVFFDVDHTLVEWTTSWSHTFVQAAGEVGVAVSDEDALAALDSAFEDRYADCVREHCRGGDENAFWLDYDGDVLRRLGVREGLEQAARRVVATLSAPHAIRLYPEVTGVLEGLAGSGVRLGIVTDRPRAGPDLSTLGIAHHFHLMVDAFSVGGVKEERRMFDAAAQAAADAGLTPWHVGDSLRRDIEASRAAGLRPVLVDREMELPDANCLRIENLDELPEVLQLGERE